MVSMAEKYALEIECAPYALKLPMTVGRTLPRRPVALGIY
jgi:hypothetical protein